MNNTKKVIDYCRKQFKREGYCHRESIEKAMLHVINIMIKSGQQWISEMIDSNELVAINGKETMVQQFKNDML